MPATTPRHSEFPTTPGTPADASARAHTLRTAVGALAAWAVLILAPGARASLMEYQYGGTITAADPSTGVAPGTRFSGTFLYDPSPRPPLIAVEGSNQYLSGHSAAFPGSVPDGSGLSLQVGGRTVYDHQGGLQVSVAELDGKYGYQSGPNTDVNISNGNVGDGPTLAALDLRNPTRAVFGTLDPPANLSLADFPEATLRVVGDAASPASKVLYSGTVDTLTNVLVPQPVPEPASAVVLGVAAATLLAYRRGRKGSGR